MAELGAGVYQSSISDVSYVNFLEWIRAERLTTLPHKGSRWDKVLIRALYFAEQLHNFDQAIQSFALDSQAAAAVGYGHARLLLEVCILPFPIYYILTSQAWPRELCSPGQGFLCSLQVLFVLLVGPASFRAPRCYR